MTRHECVDDMNEACELFSCADHPKWSVCHARTQAIVGGAWFVYAPRGTRAVANLATWREAFDFARVRAFLGDTE